MEIVSTLTLDLQKKVAQQDTINSDSGKNESSTHHSTAEQLVDNNHNNNRVMAGSEVAIKDKSSKETMQPEHRSPSEDLRSPAPQQRTTEASPSVYHTPMVFSSTPQPSGGANLDLDLAKVRTALTELNSVVKEEEELFFKQLADAESVNAQLRYQLGTTSSGLRDTNSKLEQKVEEAQVMMGKIQTESQARVEDLTESLVAKDVEIATLQAEADNVKNQLKTQVRSKDAEIAKLQADAKNLKEEMERHEELRDTNMQMQKSVEAAQVMMTKVRAESQSRVDTLNESLVARDVEIAKLQAEYKALNESKDAEMAAMKKMLELQEEETKKLRAESKTSSESLVSQESSLSHLRVEFETLQRAFDAIKAEKEEIEQGHEDAKEKWKRLVITMKSEYDNFRASFDHLKASKKEMEETYNAEKLALTQEVTKLRTENGSLLSAMDSLKICKEVSDNQFREVASSWEKTKKELEEACEKAKKQLKEDTERLQNEKEQETLNLKNQLEEESARNRAEREKEATRITEIHEEAAMRFQKRLDEVNDEKDNELARLKAQLAEETSRLLSDKESLTKSNQELENKIEELNTRYKEQVKEAVASTEKKFASIVGEFKVVKSEIYKFQQEKVDLEVESGELKANLLELTEQRDGYREELKTEIKEHTFLRQHNEELTAAHTSKTSECDALKTAVESLEVAKEAAEKTLAEMEIWKADHSEKYEAVEAERQELLKGKACAEERIATLESDNEKMSEQMAKATCDLEDIKAKLAAVEEEKANLEKELSSRIASLEEQKAEVEKQLKKQKQEADKEFKEHKIKAERQVFDLKHELEAVTADYQRTKATMDGANIVHKDEKSKLEKKIAKLNKTVETKKEALSLGLAKYLKELKAKEKAENKIGELNTTIEEKVETIKKYASELEGAEKRLAALEEIINFKDNDHKMALTKLNVRLEDSLTHEASQREAALQKQIEAETKAARLEKVVKKTEAEILAAKCHSDSVREELEKIVSERQEAIANGESLSKNLKEIEAELNSVKEQEQANAMAIKKLEQENEEARVELERAKKEAEEELETAKWKAKQHAEELKQQISSLNKSVAKKITAITALESKCETLKNTIDVSDSSASDAVKKVDFLNQMIQSKEKELDLIKSRCTNLQTSLDETEEELKKKAQLERELVEANSKGAETSILVEKKNKELQAIQERCDKLQASLKKAETLYLEGVDTIKTEAEKKQREALEEATDRVYVLNGMLTKKEEELVALKEKCDKLKSGAHGESGGEDIGEDKRAEEIKKLVNKIDFLDGLVTSKDSELELIKTRCEGLQASIIKMQEAHEKRVTLIRDEAEKNVTREQTEKEAELRALNREIAQKQSKLKALKEGDEFEIILDNGDDNDLRQEVEALRARCNGLEKDLEKAQGRSITLDAAMKVEGSQQWKTRCDELQASLDKMTKQCEEETERRKEAEQVFANLNQKQIDDISEDAKPNEKPEIKITRGVFGRSKATTEISDVGKKPSRWLGLRGRKKKEELPPRLHVETREETEHTPSRTTSPSRSWRHSQYSPHSPLRKTPDGKSSPEKAKTFIEGATDEKEHILAQIPGHIKNNFFEVGICKQRLNNSHVPVLCLGPFDVPPGPVRDEWLSKFDGKSKVLSLGVYFLGKEGRDEGAYGTIPWFSFVPYSKATQRGYDVIPKEIVKKIEAGEELTKDEKQLRDGMMALKRQAEKSKDKRTHPLSYLIKGTPTNKVDIPKCIDTDSSSSDDQVSDLGI